MSNLEKLLIVCVNTEHITAIFSQNCWLKHVKFLTNINETVAVALAGLMRLLLLRLL